MLRRREASEVKRGGQRPFEPLKGPNDKTPELVVEKR